MGPVVTRSPSSARMQPSDSLSPSASASVSLAIGLPSTGANQGLPGSWAILFEHAVVRDPAEHEALLRRGPGPRCCLRETPHPGHSGLRHFGAVLTRPARSRTYASP